MSIGEMEKGTLLALNQISKQYPYAASILLFTLIERILKLYIIENRKNSKNLDQAYKTKRTKNKSIIDFSQNDNDEFVKEYIMKITLGDIEKILNIENENYTNTRNDLFHSNSFLSTDIVKSEDERSLNNFEKYKKYTEYLFNVLDKYSDLKIKLEEFDFIVLS